VSASRAVSTVGDVALALLMLSAAMVVLVTFVETDERDHEPMEAEYTTETLLSSTMNTTYYPERALGEFHGGNVYDETDYERRDLRRVSHGPVVAQVADIAQTRVVVDLDVLRGDSGIDTLSRAADEYRARVDETLQARLVNVSFETNVSAVWEPLDGGPIRGTAAVGVTPPAYEDVSATTITVPSDTPSVRREAIDAVDDPDDFGVVAEVVAESVVEGYLPTLESGRALEGGGVDSDLTAYRYLRAADILGLGSEDRSDLAEYLEPGTANATAANELLIEELSAQLEAYLEPAGGPPESGPLGNAEMAAASIETGEVTVTVRTWT
jgi:hypothetical protein